jgi:hypothetical protein
MHYAVIIEQAEGNIPLMCLICQAVLQREQALKKSSLISVKQLNCIWKGCAKTACQSPSLRQLLNIANWWHKEKISLGYPDLCLTDTHNAL